MKNEIKKIIINGELKIVKESQINKDTMAEEIKSQKKYDLKGLVVIRENNIETYGFGKLNNVELLNKYSELVKELKEQYKDEISKLNNQDAVNKLYLLGKLEYSDKNIITNITNYIDEDENPIKFIITSTKGQDEIKITDCLDENDYVKKFKDKLVEMCNTYGIELDSKDDITNDFIEKLQLMGLLDEKQEGKIVDSKPGLNSTEITTKKEVLSDAKIKNFVVNHKLISCLIAAGVIGLVLSTHGCHKKETNNVKEVDLSTDDYLEEQVDYALYDEPIPTVEPIEYFQEIAYINEENTFPNYIETSDNKLIAKEYNGNSYNIFDSYYGNEENLIEIRNQNMSNVANYIQSNIKIQDQGIYIYHENLFNNNIIDKAFVKYFSMFGNQIIKNAYQNKDYGLVIDNAIKSDEALITLINNNKPLEVYIYGEKKFIYFNELSHDAKEMVLNIAWTNNLPLNKSIVLSGYNQDDISNIILEQANDLGISK